MRVINEFRAWMTHRRRPLLVNVPMRSKRVIKDFTLRGALLHGASCQTRTTAEGDAATTEVIESTSHKAGPNYILI
jgi:hypothetical protein